MRRARQEGQNPRRNGPLDDDHGEDHERRYRQKRKSKGRQDTERIAFSFVCHQDRQHDKHEHGEDVLDQEPTYCRVQRVVIGEHA